jgi:hypothetical protein
MPNLVKIAGAWRQITSPNTTPNIKPKVSGAWKTMTYGFVKIAGTWKVFYGFVSSISDNFSRTTSGNLGTSSSGSAWNAIRGIWFSNGTRAQSDSGASNYPIATVQMSTASAVQNIGTVNNGVGAAMWVTDSGNWFGVVAGQETVTTYYTYCATSAPADGVYYTCTVESPNTGCCTTTGAYYTAAYHVPYDGYVTSEYICDTFASYYSSYLGYIEYCAAGHNHYYVAVITYGYNVAASYYAGTTYCSCSTFSPGCPVAYTYYVCTSYGTGASNSYPAFVYILQSASNTVTTVLRTAIASVAASLRVTTTSAGAITVKAYSGLNQTTQIGTDITYAAGAKTSTNFGIIVAPSAYAQGNTLDDYSATTS